MTMTTTTKPQAQRHSIRVTFADGNTIHTDINGTRESVTAYYMGNRFNFGDVDGLDNMQTAVSVEFLQ
jgi:hypothetical protein